MKHIVRFVSILIVVGIVGAAFCLKLVTEYVPVGSVGVRTQEYAVFGKKGVVEKDYPPGWHRKLGPIDSWSIFDSTVQTLEMTRDPLHGDVKGRDDVRVKSADGYSVSVDVTIKYRIEPGNAFKLYQDSGAGAKYKTHVRNQAQNACMAIFGQMKTEDFYNPVERRQRVDKVLARLQEPSGLKKFYVEVIAVLIRSVQFDPEYENKIRRKKLADQEVELNISMGRAAEMTGKTQLISAETARKVKIIEEEKSAKLRVMEAKTDREIVSIKAASDKFVKEKTADADLVEVEKGAEGELLVKQAEAEGEKLRNESMRGVGGNTMVALEAAKNLTFSNVSISTLSTDLLDLDKMATKLGVPDPAAKE